MSNEPTKGTGPASGGTGATAPSASKTSTPAPSPTSGGTAGSISPAATPTTAAGLTTAAPSANGGAQTDVSAKQIADDLQKSGIAAGANTAAGVAISEANRTDAGTHYGDEPAGEIPETNESGPVGDQLKPATFTPGGSLPNAQVPSPTGSIPASLVADPKLADKLVADRDASARDGGRKPAHRRISHDTLAQMNRGAIKAVAYDRGYDIGEGGTRVLRARFLHEQESDEYVGDEPASTDPRKA